MNIAISVAITINFAFPVDNEEFNNGRFESSGIDRVFHLLYEKNLTPCAQLFR